MARRARGPWVVWVLPVLASMAAASPARAQGTGGDAVAAKVFEEARQLFEKKQYDLACPRFLQALDLDPTKAGVIHALAECYAEAGKVASAVARYGAYVRAVEQLPPDARAKHDDRVKRAKEQLAALTPAVPEVTLVLPATAPPATRVALDGSALEAGSVGAPLPVDPGDHVVTVTTPTGPEKQQPFKVERGEKKRLELDVGAASASPPAPTPVAPTPMPEAPPESEGMSGRRIGAFTALGVGGAGIIVGAVTGIMVLSRAGGIKDACSSPAGEAIACKTEGDVQHAMATQTLGTVSTVTFIVGGAAAALGAVLLFTEPKKTDTAGAGRFIAVGPTALGPGGAMIGAHGAF